MWEVGVVGTALEDGVGRTLEGWMGVVSFWIGALCF